MTSRRRRSRWTPPGPAWANIHLSRGPLLRKPGCRLQGVHRPLLAGGRAGWCTHLGAQLAWIAHIAAALAVVAGVARAVLGVCVHHCRATAATSSVGTLAGAVIVQEQCACMHGRRAGCTCERVIEVIAGAAALRSAHKQAGEALRRVLHQAAQAGQRGEEALRRRIDAPWCARSARETPPAATGWHAHPGRRAAS